MKYVPENHQWCSPSLLFWTRNESGCFTMKKINSILGSALLAASGLLALPEVANACTKCDFKCVQIAQCNDSKNACGNSRRGEACEVCDGIGLSTLCVPSKGGICKTFGEGENALTLDCGEKRFGQCDIRSSVKRCVNTRSFLGFKPCRLTRCRNP